jgi:hypothetical protein
MDREEHRARGPAVRLIVASTVVFVLVGCFLPATLPGQGGGEPPPQTVVYDVCTVLFWADTLFLTPTVSDWVRLPVNLLTSALWGLLAGAALCGLVCRPRRGRRAAP